MFGRMNCDVLMKNKTDFLWSLSLIIAAQTHCKLPPIKTKIGKLTKKKKKQAFHQLCRL